VQTRWQKEKDSTCREARFGVGGFDSHHHTRPKHVTKLLTQMETQTIDCEHCDVTTRSESEMRTHMILKHREEITNSADFSADVSDGYLSTETKAKKGEQFGYQK